MKLEWTNKALADLDRIYDFLVPLNKLAAKDALITIRGNANILKQYPQLGPLVEDYKKRDVRRLIVGPYELWYEALDDRIKIVRVWHMREDR